MLQRFEDFVTGITVCYKYIQRIKSAEMTEFGLKGTHVMCLFFLHRHPEGLTAAQLCQLCAEDKAAISRTIAVLQERGYITAGEKKYRAQLQLTSSGGEVARRVDHLIEQWVGLGGGGLSEQERTVFYHALELISANLRDTVEKNQNHT
jgi:DNA-binding MarR family transcriptional regulator